MILQDGYVPLLLTKRGERSALRDLSPRARAGISPLFIVDPVDWDYEHGRYKKSVVDHLRTRPQELAESWGGGSAAVDLQLISDLPMANGEHPLVWFTREANSRNLPLTPSVAIGRSASYRNAASDVVRRDGRGACIRLPYHEWPSVNGSSADLDQLMTDLGVAPNRVDLILDLAELAGDAPSMAVGAAQAELRSLPYLGDWRSLVLAGAGLPKSMPTGRGIHVLSRHDWMIYQAALTSGVPRTPTFGDYAIGHPDPVPDVDPRIMNVAATLRYTAKDDWLIAKGELFKGNQGKGIGGAAVPPVARALASHPEFRSGHCGAETWIEAARSGAAGTTGNAETWRCQGTRHHIELVTEQVANLHAP